MSGVNPLPDYTGILNEIIGGGRTISRDRQFPKYTPDMPIGSMAIIDERYVVEKAGVSADGAIIYKHYARV